MQTRIRRTNTPLSLALAALALSSAAPVMAQQGRGSSTPGDGDWSLMFTIFEPDALTNLGVFRMFGERVNLGLEVELTHSSGEQRTEQQGGLIIRSEAKDWSLLVGPSIRWYGDRLGPVSPYLRAKIAYGKGGFEADVNDDRRREEEIAEYQATLGIGAEWYPMRSIGIAGHTGIQWVQTERDITDANTQSDVEITTRNWRTFRSGLVINFYFR